MPFRASCGIIFTFVANFLSITWQTAKAEPRYSVLVTSSRSEGESTENLRELNFSIARRSLFVATIGPVSEQILRTSDPEEWLSRPQVKSGENFLQVLRNIASAASRYQVAMPKEFAELFSKEWEPAATEIINQTSIRRVFAALLDWRSEALTIEEALSLSFRAHMLADHLRNKERVQEMAVNSTEVRADEASALAKFMHESCLPVLNQIFEKVLHLHWLTHVQSDGSSTTLAPPRNEFELMRQLHGFTSAYSVLLSASEQHFFSVIPREGDELNFYAREERNRLAEKFYQELGHSLLESSDSVWNSVAKSEDFYTTIASFIKANSRFKESFISRGERVAHEIETIHSMIVAKALKSASRVAGIVVWPPVKRLLKITEIFEARLQTIPSFDPGLQQSLDLAWYTLLGSHLKNTHSSWGMPFDVKTAVAEMASLLGQNSQRLSREVYTRLLQDFFQAAGQIDPENFDIQGKNHGIGIENAFYVFMKDHGRGIPSEVYEQYREVSDALLKEKGPLFKILDAHRREIEDMRNEGLIDGSPQKRLLSYVHSVKAMALACTRFFSR